MENYYILLEVPPDADISLIRKAFRRKAKLCHPDLFQQESEGERKLQQKIFVRLSQAYEVLADPRKRNLLDQQLGKSGSKASVPRDQKNRTSSSSSSNISGNNNRPGNPRNFQKYTSLESDDTLEDILRDTGKILGQFGLNFRDPLDIFVDWARQIFQEVTEEIGEKEDIRSNSESSNHKTQETSKTDKDPLDNIESELKRLKKSPVKAKSQFTHSDRSKLFDQEIEQELRSIKKKYKL